MSSPSGGSLRVLIVDDDAPTRRIVSIALSLEDGFEVVGEAGDGKAALDVAERTQPDVILLDLEMPGMDGMQAIPVLREICPQSKIAVLSSYPDPFTLSDALNKGADTYLDKAMGLAQLPMMLLSLVNDEAEVDY